MPVEERETDSLKWYRNIDSDGGQKGTTILGKHTSIYTIQEGAARGRALCNDIGRYLKQEQRKRDNTGRAVGTRSVDRLIGMEVRNKGRTRKK